MHGTVWRIWGSESGAWLEKGRWEMVIFGGKRAQNLHFGWSWSVATGRGEGLGREGFLLLLSRAFLKEKLRTPAPSKHPVGPERTSPSHPKCVLASWGQV